MPKSRNNLCLCEGTGRYPVKHPLFGKPETTDVPTAQELKLWFEVHNDDPHKEECTGWHFIRCTARQHKRLAA